MKEAIFNQIWKKVRTRIYIITLAVISDQVRYSLKLFVRVRRKDGLKQGLTGNSLFQFSSLELHTKTNSDIIQTVTEAEDKLKKQLRERIERGFIEKELDINTIYLDKNGKEFSEYDFELNNEDDDEELEQKLKERTAQEITTKVIRKVYLDVRTPKDIYNFPRIRKNAPHSILSSLYTNKRELIKTLIGQRDNYIKQREGFKELHKAIEVGYSSDRQKSG